MTTQPLCPDCSSHRIAVIYYDAADNPIGGSFQCPECGSRNATRLVPLIQVPPVATKAVPDQAQDDRDLKQAS